MRDERTLFLRVPSVLYGGQGMAWDSRVVTVNRICQCSRDCVGGPSMVARMGWCLLGADSSHPGGVIEHRQRLRPQHEPGFPQSSVAETKVTVWSALDRVSGWTETLSDPGLVSRPWEPSPSSPDVSFWSLFPLRI
ncbi:hypothetical protein M514_10683, partial [Trichuris suis]